ncbi:MAG: hypothetical protein KKI08_15155, partial [Armatimonadetes bacterium]|nr:hypothetical protein [Armatimonadota bacterium]
MAIAEQLTCVPSAVRRGSTPRTAALAHAAAHQVYAPYAEQVRLAAEVTVPEGTDVFTANALGFAHIYPRLTPVVRDGELIVGARLRDPEGQHLVGWIPDGTAAYVEN